MRSAINPQPQPGEPDIASIQIDTKSHDDTPKILLGLQRLYTTPAVREAVFATLAQGRQEGAGEGAEQGKPAPPASGGPT